MTTAAHTRELPRYVGYVEIAEETGLDKRQIQRLIARGKFPKPDGIPTKENRWRVSVINDWLDSRNAEQKAALSDRAVTDPSKLKPEQLGDALQALGARLAALHGEQVAPDDIVGVTRQLSTEERAVIAANATAQQRELIEGILTRLDQLHYLEALILQRVYLPPLRRFADELIKRLGLDITMSEDDWRDAGWLIVDRLVNGETFAPETHPREVADALAESQILAKR